jgi:D-amino peptidase
MKVFVSVDMEGCAGIVHVDQTRSNGQDFPRCREWMTAEANAAALGAFDVGADEVVVNDSHGDMRGILIDRLDPRVELISGDLKPLSMCQGMEMAADAALFVGYHAGMGAAYAVLDHTYAGAVVSKVHVNGRELNEGGINALVAGHFGTPVVLVTGDDRTCEETVAQLGDVATLCVKKAITRYCARSITPALAQKRIREAARKAVAGAKRRKPFTMKGPYTLQLRVINAGMADHIEMMPGIRRIGGTAVEYRTGDLLELFKALLTATTLGMSSIPAVRAR